MKGFVMMQYITLLLLAIDSRAMSFPQATEFTVKVSSARRTGDPDRCTYRCEYNCVNGIDRKMSAELRERSGNSLPETEFQSEKKVAEFQLGSERYYVLPVLTLTESGTASLHFHAYAQRGGHDRFVGFAKGLHSDRSFSGQTSLWASGSFSGDSNPTMCPIRQIGVTVFAEFDESL